MIKIGVIREKFEKNNTEKLEGRFDEYLYIGIFI